MQTILKPILVPDYNLSIGSSQKLVPSVYLLINSKETDESLYNDKIKLLWVLLVDGGPDENLRYFKNIIQYCKLFYALNLDYLTIHIHALGQSVYNPVERNMLPLFKKVARIILLIDYFGNLLNFQENVHDYELGLQNFHYIGQTLADL
ncbi:22510_t:CDS:2 [Gigaspora margarita]|uniref:22510_t:CDS:1 n=1 Tax=Gigaspora margarita TaxID=4874 RepID=A0ABN7VD14_GIGMA|nr:22510_t:CDS:2 [Gigaspora margarita]